MAQLFNIQDDKVVINKLALKYLEGSVIHAGSFDIVGSASVQNDLNVKGAITVDTLTVKNLITEAGSVAEVGQWFSDVEDDLQGKGFQWSSANTVTQLSYRNGRTLWTNGSFDLTKENAYKIDNVPVLSAGELGATITRSNIKELGTLKKLSVLGDVDLAEFAYFKNGFGRLGLGTDQPNATLSIVESEIEIILGSSNIGVADIGTYTNHDVNIISDNTPRIVVKNNGEVIIGDANSKTGVLRVNGTIYTDNLVADTRIERSSSLEFKQTRDNSVYGKGLVWMGAGAAKQFILRAGGDRFWSTEDLDLAVNKAYSINEKVVLSERSLGDSVSFSKLTTLGELEALTVQGASTFYGDINAVASNLHLKTAVVTDGTQQVIVKPSGIDSDKGLALTVGEADVFYGDNDEITIGNKSNTRRPVKVYGPLSVGISNPDPTLGLAVSGDISFADKRFLTGTAIPTTGTFKKGDICWNSNPQDTSYIGWVCIIEGTPGEWLPFGAIGRR